MSGIVMIHQQAATIAESLWLHAARRPSDPWVTFARPSGQETSWTYAQMLTLARRIGRALQASGVQAGDVVAVVRRTGPELLGSALGAMLAGMVPSIFPVPSSKVSRERYAQMVRGMLTHAAPRCLIAEAADVPSLDSDGFPEVLDLERLPDDMVDSIEIDPTRIALLQHSSGTTGLQKGVMLSHEAVLQQLAAYRAAIRASEEDVFVNWLPLYHDMGLMTAFLLPLTLGARTILLDPFEWVASPESLFHAITRHRGTLCWLPNFAFQLCAASITARRLNGVWLESMRQFVNCSEPMQAEAHDAFLKRFAPFGLRTGALGCCYAMAETAFAMTEAGVSAEVVVDRIDREILRRTQRAMPSASPDALRVLSVGRPIAGVELKVTDEHRRPVEPRVVGELAVRAPFLFQGYYHHPEASAAVLDEQGFFYTGDLGYTDGAAWYVCGRKKDLLIIGGRNVYPQDIEAVVSEISGVIPGRCVAFGLFDDALGTERLIVLAESEPPAPAEEMTARIVREVEASIGIAPADVRILPRHTLIKSTSGKISRPMNRQWYQTVGQSGQTHA